MFFGPWLKPGTRCAKFGTHVVQELSICPRCGGDYWYCRECEVCTTCCWCGDYHSIACDDL